jgi:hypothetical protein
VRHDDAFVTRPDNRVGFPVADAAFLGDNGGRWSMSTRFGIKPRPEVLPLRLLYFLPR